MKLLQASSCCGCASLRTGGLIIGYLTLAFSLFNFILGHHWIFFGNFISLIGVHWLNSQIIISFCLIFSSRIFADHSYAVWHSRSKSVSSLLSVGSINLNSKSNFFTKQARLSFQCTNRQNQKIRIFSQFLGIHYSQISFSFFT